MQTIQSYNKCKLTCTLGKHLNNMSLNSSANNGNSPKIDQTQSHSALYLNSSQQNKFNGQRNKCNCKSFSVEKLIKQSVNNEHTVKTQ